MDLKVRNSSNHEIDTTNEFLGQNILYSTVGKIVENVDFKMATGRLIGCGAPQIPLNLSQRNPVWVNFWFDPYRWQIHTQTLPHLGSGIVPDGPNNVHIIATHLFTINDELIFCQKL